MTTDQSISFTSSKLPEKGILVLLIGENMSCVTQAEDLCSSEQIKRAIKAFEFTGKAKSTLEIAAPADTAYDKLILIGLGDIEKIKPNDWINLGGTICSKTGSHKQVTILAETPADLDPQNIADIALGIKLRNYSFDKYKTKGKNGEPKEKKIKQKISIASNLASAARKIWTSQSALGDGVILARDLVNEPANILGTVEFAKRAKNLEAVGCKVKILGDKELSKIGMHSLLSVSRGSVQPAQVAIIEWKGGKAKDQPIGFIGKGVTFDTGGISLKPGAGMGDMKGDMGGAATVTGLMHTLAARKAKVNVVAMIGLVENMPDADASRPGDIVTSLSGQTIEILNTDAEGRLVLADLLWYMQDKFKPKFMINLATLTGAILVALGQEHAGMFSNNDDLANQLTQSGLDTEEKVWRMPLNKKYDAMINTPNADMKNIGGRFAGSITAAQFLQRFVNECPWAHLDVAGTAMNAPKTAISTSWASGYGVRLLNNLVASHYE